MAEQRRGMGKGLAAILSGTAVEAAGNGGNSRITGDNSLRQLPIDAIEPNPNQPRDRFDGEALKQLADSLRVRGVLQPVLVRPLQDDRFELIAGERRWRAAQIAGLETIPALVQTHDDADSLEIALIENMARQDLNAVEEARACAALVDDLGLTQEEVGRRVGRSRAAVGNLIRILDLPDEVLELISDRQITEGHGRALLTTPDHELRRRLAREAAAGDWSVRELEGRIRAAMRLAEEPRATSSKTREKLHPDQEDAIRTITDSISAALGVDVTVVVSGSGCEVRLRLASITDALALAERIKK